MIINMFMGWVTCRSIADSEFQCWFMCMIMDRFREQIWVSPLYIHLYISYMYTYIHGWTLLWRRTPILRAYTHTHWTHTHTHTLFLQSSNSGQTSNRPNNTNKQTNKQASSSYNKHTNKDKRKTTPYRQLGCEDSQIYLGLEDRCRMQRAMDCTILSWFSPPTYKMLDCPTLNISSHRRMYHTKRTKQKMTPPPKFVLELK